MNRVGSWVAVLILVGIPTSLMVEAEDNLHIQFREASSEVGFSFSLAGEQNGGVGALDPWPAFPEIMGSGACWFDYDQDGYEDLYLVNQHYNNDNLYAMGMNEEHDPRNKLYRNMGDGTFKDVTEGSGVDSPAWGYGCTAADYDDDGDLDLMVTNFGDSELFRNDGGGKFTDVTAQSGINPPEGCGESTCMSITSAWADYDGDGDLDVFIGNYVESSTTDTHRGPELHFSQKNFLMRNDGGIFTNVAPAAGVDGRRSGDDWGDETGSKALGAVWFDADLDGDLDLYVANDLSFNEFYVNNGNGTFDDHSVSSGLDDNRTSMGVATGDYDQDGYPDVFFTHYSHHEHGFYRNNGDLTFEDRSGEDGLANTDELVGWGTAFLDLDRDGDLDLFAVFGHTEPQLTYRQPSKVYLNEPGDGTPGDRLWVDATADSGDGPNLEATSRGAAFADYDLDGDTDIVIINQGNQESHFLVGEGVGNNWLSILLRQPAPNVHAIGARVIVEVQGQAQTLELQAGSSYESQNSQRLDFGLGRAPAADKITVHWPGGGVTEILDVAANQAIRILSDGTYVTDTLAPLTTPVLEGLHGDEGWWQTDVDVVLETVDRNVGTPSGVALAEYSLDGGPWTAYTGPVAITEEGTHTLRYKSIDNAGNREPMGSLSLTIDNVLPEASHTLEGTPGLRGWWVGETVSVIVSASDSLSGVDFTRYRIDGGAWQTYAGPIEIEDDGVFVVEYQAVDRAGNEGEVSRLEIAHDGTNPFARLQEPTRGKLYAGDMVLPWLAEEAAVVAGPAGQVIEGIYPVEAIATDATSGVERVEFRVNGRVQVVDYEAPYTFHWDASDVGPQRVLVSARAFDYAGNELQNGVMVRVLGGTPINPN